MAKKDSKKSNKKILIIIGISLLFLIAVGTTGYLIYSHSHHRFGTGFAINNRMNGMRRSNFSFNLDNSTISQIENFFNSNPSNQSIENYCKQNPQYCGYYCFKINQSSNVCANMRPPSQPGYNGNYSGNWTRRGMRPPIQQ